MTDFVCRSGDWLVIPLSVVQGAFVANQLHSLGTVEWPAGIKFGTP